MNWLLIVVLAILIISAFIGHKNGFIKTAFSLFSVIIALTLTAWISPTINRMLRENDKVYGGIVERVEKMLLVEEEEGTKANEQISIIEGLALPQTIKDSLIENNNTDVYKALAITSFHDYISNYLAGIIINAIAFMATFLLISIILGVLCFTLNLISKLPLLNSINKTAGLIVGLVQGLIVVWLFFILITVFGSSELGQKALQMIDESQILSLIYNNNLLLRFVTGATRIFF